MKSVIKFLPVALGMLTFASCSNNDFFGGESIDAINGPELIATIEEPAAEIEGAGTRAAFETVSKKYAITWQEADKFRVYDEALQKYDEYTAKKNGENMKITLDGTAAVETPSKAIFPGDAVNYAGWDKTNNVVTATMKVPATINYGDDLGQEATTVAGQKVFAYMSNMPLWGDASKDGDNLKVSLKFLTAYTDITLYKSANVNAVRLVAGKGTATTTQLLTGDPTAFNAKTPLAGYFDAQLKDGGQLVLTSGDLKDFNKSSVLTVNNIPQLDSVHVILPVIPATYEYLSIQTSSDNGTSWTELKAYKNQQVKRNVVLKKGLVAGNAPITARVTSLEDLNAKLATIAADYAGKTVDVYLDEEVATTTALQELRIPTTLTDDQTINIKGQIKNACANLPLQIVGGTDGFVYTLNIMDGIVGTENVNINVNGDLQLVGSITSTGDAKNINVNGIEHALYLGKDAFGAFSSDMLINMAANKNLVVNAGEGVIKNVTVAGSGATQILSGEVTTLVKTGEFGDIKVEGGKINTLVASSTGITYSFKTTVGTSAGNQGGEITNLDLSNCTGDVKIYADGKTGPITTKAGNVTIMSEVESLTLKAGPTNVNLIGGNAGDEAAYAKLGKLDGGNKVVNFRASGKSALLEATNCAAGSSFKSYWNPTTADDNKKIKATDFKDGKIYTAAQLAGIGTGDYTLMSDIDIMSGTWTPVNLNGDFTAAGRTVTLNAPLFNKISGGTVGGAVVNNTRVPFRVENSFTLKSDNLGAVAKEINGTVTIQNVDVIGSISSKDEADSKNIGGIAGTAKGNVTLLDNVVNAYVGGYKNVGGFLGSVDAGTINIKTSNNIQSTVTFDYVAKSTTPKPVDAGTFGNFIGSIIGAADITIGGTAAGKGTGIDDFFDITSYGVNATTSATLKYATNIKKIDNVDKGFKGMIGDAGKGTTATITYPLNWEIGFSTAFKSLILYGNVTDNIGNPYTFTIDDINYWN